MPTDAQTVVCRANHAAEGNVLDVQALSQVIRHLKVPKSGKNPHA